MIDNTTYTPIESDRLLIEARTRREKLRSLRRKRAEVGPDRPSFNGEVRRPHVFRYIGPQPKDYFDMEVDSTFNRYCDN